MKFKYWINRIKYRREYVIVKQQLRIIQLESTNIFLKVEKDPKRSTAGDPELIRINDKANKLVIQLLKLKELMGIKN